MVALGFGILWLGYQQVIYGWVLLKGWDVRWRDLANPLSPYQWPAPGQQMPAIPSGQVLPSSTTAATAAGGGQQAPVPPSAFD